MHKLVSMLRMPLAMCLGVFVVVATSVGAYAQDGTVGTDEVVVAAEADSLLVEVPAPVPDIEPEPEPVPTSYEGPVSGKVQSQTGEPLAYAMVVVKGTTRGIPTDSDGNFTIEAKTGEILVVTYTGYTSREVEVGISPEVNIEMEQNLTIISPLKVTALGIQREEKALIYPVQEVSGDDLNRSRSANFVNSLAGKVAGVQINSSSGPGGAVKVVARGQKSLEGSNNVLYVIDGVPIHNSQGQYRRDDEGGLFTDPPSSEGIADINPDDIENLTMLTGPAAAALYGYEGANGVVLITTKKGAGDKTVITVSNNTMFSNPLMLPKFQHEYISNPGDMYTWGPKGKVNFDPKDFFQTGFNATTGVSVQTGRGKHQVYFSAANTTAEGILPNNTYDRYNFAMRYTSSFFNDKVTLDASANYIIQNDLNMVSQGWYFNPLTGLYLYPRANNFASIKDYEGYNELQESRVQNWGWNSIAQSNNPYWTMYNMNRENKKRRYMFTASVKYDITSYLNVMGRVNVDNSNLEGTWKFMSGTSLNLSGPKGRYRYRTEDSRQTYADLIVNFNKSFDGYSIFINAGGSIKDYRESSNFADGNLNDSAYTELFTIGNIKDQGVFYQDGWRQQVQSIFVNVEVGFKGMAYLTLTGRNDWDSTLAFGGNKYSIFYPSVGLSLLLDEIVTRAGARMPSWFNFAKVRFARTQVGSGLPGRYTSYPLDNPPREYSGGNYAMSRVMPYRDPKHEKTVSWEVGADLRFLNGALTLDATWYLSNTSNQTFEVPITPSGLGYTSWLIQAGNVENMGVEVALGFNKEWSMGFGWRSTLTYSYNKNTIKELIPPSFVDPNTKIPLSYNENTNVARFGDGEAMVIRLKEGGSMSDLYIQEWKWKTINGQIDDSDNGRIYAELQPGKYKKLGSMAAHSYAGWNNSFSYGGENWGNIELNIQLRGRFGGYVISTTQAYLDYFGVSQHSAELRNRRVRVNGKGVRPQYYLQALSEGGGKGTQYVYDATNIRLGEIGISYTMPRKWFKNVVGITVGFVASNVAMLYCKAPFDPEQTAGAGYNYYSGVDTFMIPSTRNLGFNIKLQF